MARDDPVAGELGNKVRRLEGMEKDLRTLSPGQVPVWNGTGWDGASKQAQHANLDALAGLTGAADKIIRFTGAGAMTTDTVTAAARTVLDDATVAAMLTTLGIACGSDTVTFSAATVSGTKTVNHGLGVSPRAILLTGAFLTRLVFTVATGSVNSTSFGAVGRTTDDVTDNASRTFYWLAIA